MGLAEESDLEEMIRLKEGLVRERDAQVEAIVALRGQVRRRVLLLLWLWLLLLLLCEAGAGLPC